jgi:hypothetical protein
MSLKPQILLESVKRPLKQWLTPVIPANQEAETRRFTVQSQPRLKNVIKTPISTNKQGMHEDMHEV